jgi:cyclase
MTGYHIEELARGVYARIGGRPLDPNSGIIVGEEGVTLIDSGYSPAAGRAIREDIARITDKPVTSVIVTHHHFDHSWGNQEFSGARIIGHANARTAMAADQPVQLQGIRNMAPTAGPWFGLSADQFNQQLDELTITPPTATYTDSMALWVDGREVQLRYLGPGHTQGDTFIYLPAERLLFGGDMICNHLIPVVGDGDPFSFGKVLDRVDAEIDVSAIVPGHGPVSDKRDLRDFNACLRELCDAVSEARDAGAPDPRAAFEQVSRRDFGGFHGREMLPGSVRRIYRAIEAAEMEAQPR